MRNGEIKSINQFIYRKLSCRTGTARRFKSVEITSTAPQMCEKSHLKRFAAGG